MRIIKNIIAYPVAIFKKIAIYFTIKKADARLNYAIIKAEKVRLKHDGERFYVMPDAFDRLVVMRRKGMRDLRRHHIMDKCVRMCNVHNECFYYTANKSGAVLSNEQRENKRRMYLRYILRDSRFISLTD